MKILSLFDGIACARVAMDRAGIPVQSYDSIEFDKYARTVADHNYPEIHRPCNDVREFEGGPGYDLIIGGSPCQDLSIAKKDRKGLDGARSGLFFEYVRILNECKPKYFILENVASMPKEAKEQITAILTEIYPETEVHMINAALVSAQNRKRLFWTNIKGITQPEDRGIYLKDILETGESVGRGAKTGLYIIQRPRGKNKCGMHTEKSPTLTSNSFEHNNKVVEPVALRNRGDGKKPEYNGTGKANARSTVQTDSMVEEQSNIRKLTPVECERLQGVPDNYSSAGGIISNSQRYKMLGNAFNVDVIAHILSFIP